MFFLAIVLQTVRYHVAGTHRYPQGPFAQQTALDIWVFREMKIILLFKHEQ